MKNEYIVFLGIFIPFIGFWIFLLFCQIEDLKKEIKEKEKEKEKPKSLSELLQETKKNCIHSFHWELVPDIDITRREQICYKCGANKKYINQF